MRFQPFAGSAVLALLVAVSPAGAATVAGDAQSPINIITADAVHAPLEALTFSYGTSESLNLVDTGSPSEEATVRADVAAGNGVTIGAVVYDLLQFHLHAEAEHLINGVRGAMELHLVHRAASGALAVVGRVITIGAENAALAPYFNALAALGSGPVGIAGFNLAALVPADLGSYRYTGSLTAPNGSNPTPPFFEPIAWNLLAAPLTVSQAQFDLFADLFPAGNARAAQPLNDRTVYTDVAAPVPLPASGLLLAGGAFLLMRRRSA